MMAAQSVNWGYILAAPGRPSERKQLAFLAGEGIRRECFGPIWSDRVGKGSTRPRHQLEERNAILLAALPGDCIHVIDPFCLGLSEADARWFMEQVVGAGVRISVAGASVDRLDQIKAVASEAGRKQNRQHVRASRGYVDPEAELPVKKSRRKWPAGPCVYRLFDADGRLLYVGCTKLYRSRRQQHRSRAEFRAEIASEQVESYPTMREALDAERLAIWDERPIYNQRRHRPQSR